MNPAFFGLHEQPFNPTPDPRFLHLTPGHREALAQLVYGVQERKGFLLLTGEVGTGKTTLVQALLRRLARVRNRLIERLRRLPAASLRDPAHRYPVTAWVPEFAWTHERQHLRRLRGWWKGRRAGKAARSGGGRGSHRAATAGPGEPNRGPRKP